MGTLKSMTPEQVDKHIEALGFGGTKKPALGATKKTLADYYKAARPILVQALGILKFVKKNWATVLEGLIASLDDAFPQK